MIGILLALALPAMAQQQATATPAPASASATSSQDSTRTDALDISLQALQSGKPVYTSTPTFKGGVCFADGTCQTTAASAASASIICAGGGVLVSSQDFTRVSSVTFAVPTSSTDYKFNYVVISTNATHFFVLPNNDTGTNYANSNAWQSGANAWGTGSGGTGQHGWLWDNDNGCGLTLASFSGGFTGSDLVQNVNGYWFHNNQATGYAVETPLSGHFIATGAYTKAAATVSTITIFASATCSTSAPAAGPTFTGHIELCESNFQHK